MGGCINAVSAWLVVSYVAFALSLVVTHLFLFYWLGMAVLRDCDISSASFLIL